MCKAAYQLRYNLLRHLEPGVRTEYGLWEKMTKQQRDRYGDTNGFANTKQGIREKALKERETMRSGGMELHTFLHSIVIISSPSLPLCRRALGIGWQQNFVNLQSQHCRRHHRQLLLYAGRLTRVDLSLSNRRQVSQQFACADRHPNRSHSGGLYFARRSILQAADGEGEVQRPLPNSSEPAQ